MLGSSSYRALLAPSLSRSPKQARQVSILKMASSRPQLQDPSLFRTQQYIGGAWSDPRGDETFDVTDPGTGAPWLTLRSSSLADADAAIAAAQAAFPAFAATLARDRARKLMEFDCLLRANLKDIATLLVWETGKPMAEAIGEVEYALTFSWWAIGEPERIAGMTVKGVANKDARFFTIKQPIGPVALLTPWNFPVALFVRKAATALAAGCTFVAKPSPETPVATLAVAHLLERAGFTGGVVNAVLASNGTTPAMGELFCKDRRIKKISFTGSTRVGRILMQQSAASLKKLTLELGGSGAFVIFEDADFAKACAALVANRTRHAGQICIGGQRVLLQRSVVDRFLPALLQALGKVKMGHGLDPSTTLGPVETQRSKDKALEHIRDAQAKGAKIHIADVPTPDKGFFVAPTVIVGCNNSMLVYQEESFAPLVNIATFETEEEAMAMANDTDMGLTNYCFTENASRLWRCYENLHAGNIGLNTGNTTSSEAPFGGIEQSGLGKESRGGIEEYLIEKAATMVL